MATVSKNIFWQTISAFLQIYTGGIIFILLVKVLSMRDFGLLTFGFSFATLLATCLDFGQSLMIMKDVPQNAFSAEKYIMNTLAQKMLLVVFFCSLFSIYLFLFYSGEWRIVGQIFVLFAVLTSYALYLQAVLRVRNRFRDASLSILLYSAVITFLMFLIYMGTIDIKGFIWFLVVARIVQLVALMVFCRDIFVKNWYSKKIQKHLLKYSWSYGAQFIFGTFYFMADTQIIALLLSAEDVALYQSIFRIVYILLIVSDVASNVLLPYLSSKYFKESSIDEISTNLTHFLLILGCLLFISFSFFYSEIIELLYTPEYKSAYSLVLPLSMLIIIRTVTALYGTLLTISNNQVNRVKVVFVSMILSISLNLSLIPYFGILGSAWISVGVHMVLLLGYVWYSKEDFPNIELLSKKNILVIGLTLVFLIFEKSLTHDFIISAGLVVLWGVIILFLVKKYKMIPFFKQILEDKGVV